jgi:hypothetical protein
MCILFPSVLLKVRLLRISIACPDTIPNKESRLKLHDNGRGKAICRDIRFLEIAATTTG